MYKILIKTYTTSNNIWTFYQLDGVDYTAASLQEMKETTLNLVRKYGKRHIKIINQLSGDDSVDLLDYILEVNE